MSIPCYHCLLLFNGLTLCCDFTQEELDPHFTRLTNSSNLRALTFEIWHVFCDFIVKYHLAKKRNCCPGSAFLTHCQILNVLVWWSIPVCVQSVYSEILFWMEEPVLQVRLLGIVKKSYLAVVLGRSFLRGRQTGFFFTSFSVCSQLDNELLPESIVLTYTYNC